MQKLAMAATCLLMPALAAAQSPGKAPPPAASPAPAATADAPFVADQADRLLKQMSDYIASADQFTVHADITFDHVLPTGQKLQYMAAEDVALHRPGRLHVRWSSDLGDREFWYDGKSVTLTDPSTPFYASEPAPGTIDAMLRMAEAQLGFVPPLSDMLVGDPYQALRGKLQYGIPLGQAVINGRTCNALAFVEKDIDWQIWIDAGPQLTPCKLVITYKTHPSQPQFSAVFSEWNFAPRIADPVFTPDLPPGAKKIEFAPMAANTPAR